MAIDGLFHPSLKTPVKNYFQTDQNVIVLNGANMSGKSTFLKAVSICVYLAHLGLAVPANKASLPFYTYFSVAINRSDSLQNGYSHFMTEIQNLKKVVLHAQQGIACFAVFDELFSGTNVEDAFAISKTTLKGLGQFTNSLFFVSTHIQELKDVSHSQLANYYMDCQLVHQQPTFTYQLKQGWSPVQIGQLLFEKEGLNALLK